MSPESSTPHDSQVEQETYRRMVSEYVGAISIADITDHDEAHRLRVELAALRTNGVSFRRMTRTSSQTEEDIV